MSHHCFRFCFHLPAVLPLYEHQQVQDTLLLGHWRLLLFSCLARLELQGKGCKQYYHIMTYSGFNFKITRVFVPLKKIPHFLIFQCGKVL